MEESIFSFVRDYYNLEDGVWAIERYVGYDEFPKENIRPILQSSQPETSMMELEYDWTSTEDWEYQDDFWAKFESFCSARLFNFDIAKSIVYENFYFSYPRNFMNPLFNAVIRINAGDMNYDYTCHNVLNYARKEGYPVKENGTLMEEAGLHWLAKQQGRLALLQQNIAESDCYSNGKCEGSKFVASAITSLINLPTAMSALTFLVKMHLQDAISIMQAVKNRKDAFDKYKPHMTDGMPLGHMTLGKETKCLLYDAWNVSGSLETIELEKDVVVPIHYIQDIDVDTQVESLYGFVSSVWKDSIKELDVKD